jgi:energy-coupling factor transporter ATP-binding protein EcfA2
MFKIYQLTIKGIEPFSAATSFEFGPYFNLIRGDNGAGKTTVLEAMAMLGHCSIMAHDKSFDLNEGKHCYIEYRLILGEPFFNDMNDSEIRRLAKMWKDITIAKDIERTFTQIPVYIFHKDKKPVKELKEHLKDESKLKEDWRIAGDEFQITFLQRLVHFSRPTQIQSEADLLTQNIRKTVERISVAANERALNDEEIAKCADQIIDMATNAKPQYRCPERSKYLGRSAILPPLICYFNTDMYHYGIGLDIRESPKHLSLELSSLVKHRLHLVNRDNSLINLPLARELWANIFKGEEFRGEHRETLGDVRFKYSEEGKDEAVISIHGGKGEPRNFMSSGENQVLSLSIPLMMLEPKHSILLLDEPELHLSLPAAVQMYDEVVKRSLIDDIQVVTVSHLPFVFPQSLLERDQIRSVDKFCKLYMDINASVNSLLNAESVSEHWPPRYITLYYLKKEIEKGAITQFSQREAVYEAGKFQNRELDCIRRQTHSQIEWKTFWRETWRLTWSRGEGATK